MFCRDYVKKGDLLHNILQYAYLGGRTEEIQLPARDIYVCEMELFLDMIDRTKNNDNDIVHANEVLKIALCS